MEDSPRTTSRRGTRTDVFWASRNIIQEDDSRIIRKLQRRAGQPEQARRVVPAISQGLESHGPQTGKAPDAIFAGRIDPRSGEKRRDTKSFELGLEHLQDLPRAVVRVSLDDGYGTVPRAQEPHGLHDGAEEPRQKVHDLAEVEGQEVLQAALGRLGSEMGVPCRVDARAPHGGESGVVWVQDCLHIARDFGPHGLGDRVQGWRRSRAYVLAPPAVQFSGHITCCSGSFPCVIEPVFGFDTSFFLVSELSENVTQGHLVSGPAACERRYWELSPECVRKCIATSEMAATDSQESSLLCDQNTMLIGHAANLLRKTTQQLGISWKQSTVEKGKS